MNGANGMKCKPNSELESRPAGAEIEVTPEMIEAGIGILLRYHREYSDEADVVREIFLRMMFVP